jgi:alcohol-forming fatty acyl-CoA reductase
VLASTKFSEKLHDAVDINILNTQKIVKIANQIENLKSFVHVSTLYSNCNRNFIDETIYDHDIDYQQLIKLAEVSKQIENQKTVKLNFHHDFSQNYQLSKHFAEKLVVDQVRDIPVGIFRPPIIASSYKTKPGWTDNIFGISGIAVVLIKGYGHCWLGNDQNEANLAPVDYCANALIAAAWDVAEKFKKSRESHERFTIPMYNYVHEENDLTFGDIFEYGPLGFHATFEGSIYYLSCIRTQWKFLFLFLHFLTSTLPAFILDNLMKLAGKKSNFMRMSNKIKEYFLILSLGTLKKFRFGNKNMLKLMDKVDNLEGNMENLKFNLKDIDWKIFFANHQPGLKRYFFKENMSEERLDVLRKSYER